MFGSPRELGDAAARPAAVAGQQHLAPQPELAQVVDGLARLRPRLVGEQHPAEELGAARDPSHGAVVVGRRRDRDAELLEQLGAAERDAVLPQPADHAQAARFLDLVERAAGRARPASRARG